MQNQVGIMRTADDLKQPIEGIRGLQERARNMRVEGSRLYNPGWHLSWDVRNMLMMAEAVARCALQREESRGGHTRLDFMETDKVKWEKLTSVVCKQNEEMIVETQPKPEMPAELAALVAG